MNYYDIRRPRLANGRPAWLTAPLVALPSIILTPQPTCTYHMAFMINGSFKYLVTFQPALPLLISEWIESPENFALTKFGIIPTTSAPDHPIPPHTDPTSLGF